jgi:hypothetical protein
MNETAFWQVVETAKQEAGGDRDQRPGALERLLAPLSLDEIQAFQHLYDAQLIKAHQWHLWGAASVMNGGCSDDGFRYFRDWLISEGRSRFEAALEDPDSLADVPKSEWFDLELFGYAALKAFEQQGGGELERNFHDVEFAEPKGREWESHELPTLFPRLTKIYGAT